MCDLVQAATGAEIRLAGRKRNFSAQNLHTISTDAHIDDLVIPLGGAHENATGTVHFDTLLDQNALVAGGNAVGNRPCGAASRG